ncbi:MAG: EAL domain-containing protein [Pseudomonadota bacterium]
MERPENVADAILADAQGCVEGRYKDYVLKPAYQPIFGIDENDDWEISGFEGLVRPHKEGQVVNTADFFLDVGKKDELFVECMCMALHIRAYKTVKPENGILFINIDVSKFPSVDVLETELFYTFSQLPKNGLNRSKVVFEILETEILEKEVLLRICEMFRNNGFRFALDDFGTKHSNIERFLLVKPDIVKLDRSIFQNFCKIKETETLLRALIGAFRNNNSKVLMEGLESSEEIALATDMNIDMMQGFALARPKILPHSFKGQVSIPELERKPNLQLVEDKGLKAYG